MSKIKEIAEQALSRPSVLDELSKDTLKSYISKATQANKDKAGGDLTAQYSDPDIKKRKSNIRAANFKAAFAKSLPKPVATPAPKEPVDKEKLHAQLKDLTSKFDPEYAHSDDHDVFTKHSKIASQIHSIRKQLSEAELEELSTGTLDSYAAKARTDANKSMAKADKSKNLKRAMDLYTSASKRHLAAGKAEQKSRTKSVIDSWKK